MISETRQVKLRISEKVRFRHCDPAGIVFYPRYFEMISDSIETFFETVLGLSFCALHDTGAVPTVAIEAVFPAPSRIGDLLEISVTPVHLGRTSLGIETRALCSEEIRFFSKATLVLTSADGTPRAWPASVAKTLDNQSGDLNDA